MDIEHIESLAQNPMAQTAVGAGTVVAAHGEKIAEAASKIHWYDPIWQPIWEFLPWTQIATVLGVPLVTYSLYVTIKNAIENK